MKSPKGRAKEKWIIGVDEVGRGPVAGPVTIAVCACPEIMLKNKKKKHSGVGDSKKTSKARREKVAELLQQDDDVRIALASVSAGVIDKIGISKALRAAVGRGLKSLSLSVDQMEVRLDGRLYAPSQYTQTTITGGDASEWVIGAASIVAKVHRDARMTRLGKKYPRYGFEQHKGYGTAKHCQAIKEYGPCREHRASFLGRILSR